MRRVMISVGAVLVLAGSYGWWHYRGPCGVSRVAAGRATLGALERRWSDTIKVIANTPREALSDRVTELQAIRRDVLAAEVPACMERGRGLLGGGMLVAIDDIAAFMGGAPASDQSKREEAMHKLGLARSEMAAVQKCAPRCGD